MLKTHKIQSINQSFIGHNTFYITFVYSFAFT